MALRLTVSSTLSKVLKILLRLGMWFITPEVSIGGSGPPLSRDSVQTEVTVTLKVLARATLSVIIVGIAGRLDFTAQKTETENSCSPKNSWS